MHHHHRHHHHHHYRLSSLQHRSRIMATTVFQNLWKPRARVRVPCLQHLPHPISRLYHLRIHHLLIHHHHHHPPRWIPCRFHRVVTGTVLYDRFFSHEPFAFRASRMRSLITNVDHGVPEKRMTMSMNVRQQDLVVIDYNAPRPCRCFPQLVNRSSNIPNH